MTTYKIVRHYMNNDALNHTVRGLTGLTLEQARAHCKDPETSAHTCTSAEGKARTRKHGPWFDGFAEER